MASLPIVVVVIGGKQHISLSVGLHGSPHPVLKYMLWFDHDLHHDEGFALSGGQQRQEG